MPVLRLHPEASRELESALQLYADRSPVAAAAFLREVEQGLERIQAAPGRWHRVGALARRYLLARFPFSLVYRVVSGDIQLLAVAHDRRRPGYWRSRNSSVNTNRWDFRSQRT